MDLLDFVEKIHARGGNLVCIMIRNVAAQGQAWRDGLYLNSVTHRRMSVATRPGGSGTLLISSHLSYTSRILKVSKLVSTLGGDRSRIAAPSERCFIIDVAW